MNMNGRKLLVGLALAALLAGCRGQRAEKAGGPEDWFRLTLGAGDAEPADWSGSVEAAGGRVAAIVPHRFDKDDKLDAASNSWKCHTRRAAVPNPRDWYVGALHIVPKDFTVPLGPMIPNELFVAVAGAAEVRFKTAQGEFRFQPGEVLIGEAAKMLLGGRVAVERAPQPVALTTGDGMEDDYPAVAVDSGGASWVAWTGYYTGKEMLFVARADGTGKSVVAEGEFFRPVLAAGPGGKLYLAASVRDGETWKIGVAQWDGKAWSRLDRISPGGPDLSPRAAVDSTGALWVAWQGFRDGRSRILGRRLSGGQWDAPIEVSANSRNAWEPSVAGDA